MKKISKILTKGIVLVSMIAAISSCSSDDGNSGTKVRYSLYTSADMITDISFEAKDGSSTSVSLTSVTTEWAKTIYVNPPFEASVSAEFENTTETPQTYSLTIYVDDVAAETTTGTVNAGVTGSAIISENIAQ